MRKFLPKSRKTEGFTLIELMVVIAIIAILAIIGFTVFTGQQKAARDARRKGDVDSISQAMEANKGTSATYTALAASMFSSGIMPVDPGSGTNPLQTYAESDNATALPTAWGNAAVPSAPGTWNTVATGKPGADTSWIVCAQLETPVNGSDFYCRVSAQQ